MRNILGVDFGTTSLKACLFNEKGELLVSESAEYKLITEGEFIEFSAEEFFNVFKGVYDKIAKQYKIDSFAIDTQGETIILLDKEGNALTNAVIWLDNRAEKEAQEFEKKFGIKWVYEKTGQAEVPAGYPAPKIMWFKKNKPEIFNKVDKFLLLEDYIIYKLTGKCSASRSLYSSSLLMDVKTGEYIPEVLDYLGITESQLPTLCESGEIVGEYNGAKVVTSALDQIAGITGAGVIKEGMVSETTGTCLSVCAVTEKFPPYYDGLKVSAYYVKKGTYCLLMYAPTAGATLEWFKRVFCAGASHTDMNTLAEKVEEGSEGLICIPHLCGTVMPENNPKIKGVFYGIELKHEQGHFYRAIMESIAYTIKDYIEFMGVPVKEIRSMGGGAKSKLWNSIKSAVTGKTVETLTQNETACLGSAIFAGVGAKIVPSIEEAVNNFVSIKATYKYESKEYERLYKEYKEKTKKIIDATF